MTNIVFISGGLLGVDMSRLLIAEDDSALRMILKKGLIKKGYDPIICPNGKEALEVLKKDQNFDLILTDMMMPKMDGRELIENIRSNDNLKNIPVIIMSGVVSIKEISDLLKTGASAFIPKPIKINDLDNEIKEVVGLTDWGVNLNNSQK